MQTSCFFVLQFFQNINSTTTMTGGGGSCSDFPSLQTLAGSEQVSSFFSFLSNARFWFLSLMWFVSSESGKTLLLLN